MLSRWKVVTVWPAPLGPLGEGLHQGAGVAPFAGTAVEDHNLFAHVDLSPFSY